MLDEFGATKYSFNDIKEFNIDYLKISSSLTNNIFDEKVEAIVKGIIDLAHSLKIKVICENFETKENDYILKRINCDIVQGNAYYKPMPINAMQQTNYT